MGWKGPERETQAIFNAWLLSGHKNDAWLLNMRACPACLLSWVFICVLRHVEKMLISFLLIKASSWMQALYRFPVLLLVSRSLS